MARVRASEWPWAAHSVRQTSAPWPASLWAACSARVSQHGCRRQGWTGRLAVTLSDHWEPTHPRPTCVVARFARLLAPHVSATLGDQPPWGPTSHLNWNRDALDDSGCAGSGCPGANPGTDCWCLLAAADRGSGPLTQSRRGAQSHLPVELVSVQRLRSTPPCRRRRRIRGRGCCAGR